MSDIVVPREWLTERLRENLEKFQTLQSVRSVLVLGGSELEPELKLFTGSRVEVHFAGIAAVNAGERFHYVDLNHTQVPKIEYDLVICNQVIEHLHNLGQAFFNIASLVNTGGFLWLTCPANNFRHGSPEYFSAGYSSEFIAKNFAEVGFNALDVGEISSKRVYLYRHLLRIWPTARQIRFPFFSYFGVDGTALTKIFFNLTTIISRINISSSSPKLQIDGDYPLETFGFFRKAE